MLGQPECRIAGPDSHRAPYVSFPVCFIGRETRDGAHVFHCARVLHRVFHRSCVLSRVFHRVFYRARVFHRALHRVFYRKVHRVFHLVFHRV